MSIADKSRVTQHLYQRYYNPKGLHPRVQDKIPIFCIQIVLLDKMYPTRPLSLALNQMTAIIATSS